MHNISLHKLFSELIDILNLSIDKSSEDSEYRKKEKDYYVKFHSVITAYEAIFKDLYEKEKMLNQELQKSNDEMDDDKDFTPPEEEWFLSSFSVDAV